MARKIQVTLTEKQRHFIQVARVNRDLAKTLFRRHFQKAGADDSHVLGFSGIKRLNKNEYTSGITDSIFKGAGLVFGINTHDWDRRVDDDIMSICAVLYEIYQ